MTGSAGLDIWWFGTNGSATMLLKMKHAGVLEEKASHTIYIPSPVHDAQSPSLASLFYNVGTPPGCSHLSPSKPSPAKAAAPATTTTTHLANRSLGVHNTTILAPPRSRIDSQGLLLVDAEADPSKDTLIESLADECVPHDGVVAVGAHLEQEIGRV